MRELVPRNGELGCTNGINGVWLAMRVQGLLRTATAPVHRGLLPRCLQLMMEKSKHRDTCFRERLFPWNAAVARPVGKAAIARTPKAKAAMDKEWKRLRDKRVWVEEKPREWDDV